MGEEKEYDLTPEEREKREKEKKQTQIWKAKQLQKKKKKQEAMKNGDGANEKAKKKDKANKKSNQQKSEQQPEKKSELKQELRPVKAEQIIPTQSEKQSQFKIPTTIEKHLLSNHKPIPNKKFNQTLIEQDLEQYVSTQDTILVLEGEDTNAQNSSSILSGHPKVVCLIYPGEKITKNISSRPLNQSQQQEIITCLYEDLPVVMQSTITKVFVPLEIIFKNGSSLLKKGHDSIITLANHYKVPVIGFTGSWNINFSMILSLDSLFSKFGYGIVSKYDYVQGQEFEIIVFEFGSVIPKQVGNHLDTLETIYSRDIDLKGLKW